MTAPRLIFDSDRGAAGNTAQTRTYNVVANKPVKLTAAGIAAGESVQIYVAARAPNNANAGANNTGCGATFNDAMLDYIWSPLYRCGKPVQLSDTNNQWIESIPGTYIVGDPVVAPVFTGDVNITSEELGVEYLSLPGECPADDGTPQPPVPADYETCAGVVTVDTATAVQAIIPPGTVVYTKSCDPVAEYDTNVLCDPATGDTVLVVTTYSPAGIPATLAYNLDGSAYAGAVADLVKCPDVELESDAVEMCDAGVPFLRWFVKLDGKPTGTVFNTDLTGAVYNPSGAETLGACPAAQRSVLVYMERNGGVVSMADIVGATGSSIIHSVTVKQISGRGTVTGDSGSGVPLDAGETWSWSAISPDNQDTFATSALALDANGGEQRITATYTL